MQTPSEFEKAIANIKVHPARLMIVGPYTNLRKLMNPEEIANYIRCGIYVRESTGEVFVPRINNQW